MSSSSAKIYYALFKQFLHTIQATTKIMSWLTTLTRSYAHNTLMRAVFSNEKRQRIKNRENLFHNSRKSVIRVYSNRRWTGNRNIRNNISIFLVRRRNSRLHDITPQSDLQSAYPFTMRRAGNKIVNINYLGLYQFAINHYYICHECHRL